MVAGSQASERKAKNETARGGPETLDAKSTGRGWASRGQPQRPPGGGTHRTETRGGVRWGARALAEEACFSRTRSYWLLRRPCHCMDARPCGPRASSARHTPCLSCCIRRGGCNRHGLARERRKKENIKAKGECSERPSASMGDTCPIQDNKLSRLAMQGKMGNAYGIGVI